MLVKQAIKILLTEDPGLAALVGERIFPKRLAQKTDFPGLAWGRTKRKVPENLHSYQAEQRLVTDWFEFYSLGQGPSGNSTSEDIDDALLELLQDFSGTVYSADSPSDTLVIQGIFHEDLEEDYRDPLQQYATRSVYRVHSIRKQRPAL